MTPARAASTVIGDVGQRPVRALSFTLVCTPPTKTAQHKGVRVVNGHAMHYEKPEQVAIGNLYVGLLRPYQPAEPLQGAVAITIDVTWPWRASETKRNLALGRMPHTGRPDLDNFEKKLVDTIAAMRFVENDSKIADKHTRKWWGDKPGITIEIRELQCYARARGQGGVEGES